MTTTCGTGRAPKFTEHDKLPDRDMLPVHNPTLTVTPRVVGLVFREDYVACGYCNGIYMLPTMNQHFLRCTEAVAKQKIIKEEKSIEVGKEKAKETIEKIKKAKNEAANLFRSKLKKIFKSQRPKPREFTARKRSAEAQTQSQPKMPPKVRVHKVAIDLLENETTDDDSDDFSIYSFTSSRSSSPKVASRVPVVASAPKSKARASAPEAMQDYDSPAEYDLDDAFFTNLMRGTPDRKPAAKNKKLPSEESMDRVDKVFIKTMKAMTQEYMAQRAGIKKERCKNRRTTQPPCDEEAQRGVKRSSVAIAMPKKKRSKN